jgi:hypothetical protein
MTNAWTDILTPAQLAANYALTATLDPVFAIQEKEFWESRSVAQLHSIRYGAWYANDNHGYQMARSYLALAGATDTEHVFLDQPNAIDYQLLPRQWK